MGTTADTQATAAAPARPSYFVRRVTAVRDFELFFVAAVATILTVRAILAATGWPQLGGGTIHFAHLLWGGVGMLLALILYMALEGRLWFQLATLSAGIGFGLFIDELGKFITSNNNYFFRPAVAIMYVLFVVLFFVFRWLGRVANISGQAALVNAFDFSKEAVLSNMDQAEKDEALWLLRRADQDSAVVQTLTGMVLAMEPAGVGVDPFTSLKRTVRRVYDGIVHRRWFTRIVIGWFLLTSILGVIDPFIGDTSPLDLSFAQKGGLVSGLITGAFVIVGLVRWRHSRLVAYHWLERGVLVSILIGEFFSFYQDQVWAIFGLLWLLVTLGVMRSMIAAETARAAAAADAADQGGDRGPHQG